MFIGSENNESTMEFILMGCYSFWGTKPL